MILACITVLPSVTLDTGPWMWPPPAPEERYLHNQEAPQQQTNSVSQQSHRSWRSHQIPAHTSRAFINLREPTYMAPALQPTDLQPILVQAVCTHHPLTMPLELVYLPPASPPVHFRMPTLSPINLSPHASKGLSRPSKPLFIQSRSSHSPLLSIDRRPIVDIASDDHYDAAINDNDDPGLEQMSTHTHEHTGQENDEDKQEYTHDYEQKYEQESGQEFEQESEQWDVQGKEDGDDHVCDDNVITPRRSQVFFKKILTDRFLINDHAIGIR